MNDIVHEPNGAGMGYVYLIHFHRPISNGHTTQHYVGFTKDLYLRMKYHLEGRGARLTQVAVERGIPFCVVRVWRGSRSLERAVKSQHNSPRFCPLCQDSRDVEAIELTTDQIEEILSVPF